MKTACCPQVTLLEKLIRRFVSQYRFNSFSCRRQNLAMDNNLQRMVSLGCVPAGRLKPHVCRHRRTRRHTECRNQSVFYSVKLDLGMDCEFLYPGAVTPELNNPVKVSSAILRAMKDAAEKALGRSLSGVPTVITIPASFMSPQRRDTLMAAKMAGLELGPEALFDEPVAALLGYINRRRIQQR